MGQAIAIPGVLRTSLHLYLDYKTCVVYSTNA